MFMSENNTASSIRVVTGTDIVINIPSKISETNKCSIVLQIKNRLLLVLIIHYSKSCRDLNFNVTLPLLKLFNFKCCFLQFFPHFVITLDMKYSDPALWTSFNKLALGLLLLKTRPGTILQAINEHRSLNVEVKYQCILSLGHHRGKEPSLTVTFTINYL